MKEIKYSTLSLREMFKLYNERAKEVGKPPLRVRPKDRVGMAKALALLCTFRVKPPPPPVKNGFEAEVRDVAIEELCKVDYLEDMPSGKQRSVGFSYTIVLARIRVRLPKSRITSPGLRAHATHIRQGTCGYDRAKLPDHRPHSNSKKDKAK